MNLDHYTFISLFLLIIIFCFSSCNRDCERGEMWREKIEIEEGSYVFLYHTADCRKEKPLMLNKEEMIHYMKKKYDVFDFCFDNSELRMLSVISKHNIKDFIDNAPLYFEEDSEWEQYKKDTLFFDKSPCKHSAKYAIHDGQLVPLKNEWVP